MKKVVEKTAIIILVAVGSVFVTLALMSAANGLGSVGTLPEAFIFAVIIALSAMYVGAAIAAIIAVFAGKAPQLLTLFSDKTSATRVSQASAKRLIKKTAENQKSVKIVKSAFEQDDKGGLELKIWLDIFGASAEETSDKLRCALSDSFANALGVKLDKIDFVIRKLRAKYKSDGEKVRLAALALKQNRENCAICANDAVTLANAHVAEPEYSVQTQTSPATAPEFPPTPQEDLSPSAANVIDISIPLSSEESQPLQEATPTAKVRTKKPTAPKQPPAAPPLS